VITELRRYRIKADKVDSWLPFIAQAMAENERLGARVEYAGLDRESSTFVWLRSYEDEADRKRRKDEFYGSAWWVEREAFAMDHVLEYDVTFLDATVIRDGAPTAAPWPPTGDRPGSIADGPPEGWTASTRRTFVPTPR
jgi:hypothetical protein